VRKGKNFYSFFGKISTAPGEADVFVGTLKNPEGQAKGVFKLIKGGEQLPSNCSIPPPPSPFKNATASVSVWPMPESFVRASGKSVALAHLARSPAHCNVRWTKLTLMGLITHISC
jgi:hypothetical protein